MKPFAIALLALVTIAALSCNKDNKAAKDLDGTWQMESWTYAGKDTIPAGTANIGETFWVFAKCKSSATNCHGHQHGFLGGVQQEDFEWFFSNKGATFDMGSGAFTSAASMNQLAGSWDVETLDDETFVIGTSSCGTCATVGRSTVTFKRID